MDGLKLYEINREYVDYLSQFEPHMFLNKKDDQINERKYVGIILKVNGLNYFAPLSSYKEKHKYMKDGIDMIKLKEYAVINLNNMFPVPENEYEYIDISAVKDLKYKNLLIAEYRYILHIQNRIKQNAKNIYTIKMRDGDSTPLSKRCHNFKILEEACDNYLRLK